MNDTYINDEIFSGKDFSISPIMKGEYDSCRFEYCNFENVHASNIQFVDCVFVHCNFSNAIVKNTAFKDVVFNQCKLMGVQFSECDPFLLQLKFSNCQLDFSSFYQLNIPNTNFVNCSLNSVDFTESNLEKAVFNSCNLKNAIFDTSNLEKSDFRTAKNISISPDENKLRGAKFSINSVSGLLNKYQIVIE